MSGEDHDALMHRRANAPEGKLTEHVDFMCSEELKDALTTLAHLKGFNNRSEYTRDVMHKHAFGELEALRLLARMTNRNPGNP